MNSERRFGTWMEQALMRREMSQSDLAQRMEIAPITVSQWVRGKRIPNVASCFAIADALDLPVAHVMREAGHPVEDDADTDRTMEDELVAMWRKLSLDGQQATVQFVEFQRGRERKGS